MNVHLVAYKVIHNNKRLWVQCWKCDYRKFFENLLLKDLETLDLYIIYDVFVMINESVKSSYDDSRDVIMNQLVTAANLHTDSE